MKRSRLAGMVISLLTVMLFSCGSALGQSSDSLVVNEIGHVGIATESPDQLLTISNAADKSGLNIRSGTSNNGLYLTSDSAAQALITGGAEFTGTSVSGENAWLARATSSSAVWMKLGTLEFYTDSGLTQGNNFTPTRRMMIDALGNVGIGGDLPNQKLQVDGMVKITNGTTAGNGKIRLTDDQNDTGFSSIAGLSEGLALSAGGDAELYTHVYIQEGGNVGIGVTEFGSGGTKVLALGNGTAPTTSPADMIQLYARNFADPQDPLQTATSELFVRDEDGSAVDLSPHIFALFQPDAAEPFPWSYYAENNYLGKVINVDMAGAIRAIERLSGKQFIFYSDVPKADVQTEKREEWKKNWIRQNTTELEVSKDAALEVVQVMVADTSNVVSEKVTYELEGRNVIEIRTPVYAQKAEDRWQLKKGARFDTETGKFFMKTMPTEAEAEAAVSTQFQLVVKKWIRDRL